MRVVILAALLLALWPALALAEVTCKPFPGDPNRLMCSDGTMPYIVPGFQVP